MKQIILIISFSNTGKKIVSWDKNGDLHRDNDLPAHIGGGAEYWYQYGKLHRDDGPAIITTVAEFWYTNGERISENYKK